MIFRLCMLAFGFVPLMGQTDLWVSSQSGTGSNIIYLNDGNGNFTDTQQSLGVSLSLSAAYGDLDGDGDIDVADAADPGCWIYINDGQGNLTQTSGYGADLPITRSIALADLDGDLDLDLIMGVAISQFTSACEIHLNNGSGQFTFLESFGTEDTRAIAVADLNGDTFPDIFEANRGEEDRVWLNNGSGSFTDSGQLLTSMQSFAVALADVEMDGDLDALVAIDGSPNQLWLNDGAGNFSASSQVFTTASSLACAFADVDQDGHQDIVIGNDGAVNSDQLEIWINDGSGSFTRNANTSPAYRTVGMSLGDIDGDGDLDLYLANFGDDKILRNDGNGIFTETANTLSASTSNAGLLIFLQDGFDSAIAKWNARYSILSLIQFQDQLEATFDYRRGR